MRIIYIHQYFKKITENGSHRSWYLANALSSTGFDVQMITTHNLPPTTEKINENFTVHYLNVPYDNDFGFFKRILAFLSFFWKSFFLARKLIKQNQKQNQKNNKSEKTLIYATSTPLTVGIMAFLLEKFYKTPYFFEVRDLWPEAPIQMKVIKNAILIKILRFFEKKIYQNASKIITLSPAMQTHVEEVLQTKTTPNPSKMLALKSRGTEKTKTTPNPSLKSRGITKEVLMFPNMSDNEFFSHKTGKKVLDNFSVVYFGTIGKANHLEYLLNIAKFGHENNKKVDFFIVGAGAEKKRLEEIAYDLPNVLFIKAIPKDLINIFLGEMSAVYVSFLDIPVLESCSPNKFFDALAAGKLCITNTKGWLKTLVEDNKCGFYASPHNPADFWKQLDVFINDVEMLKKYECNARHLAETKFDKNKICTDFIQVFQ